MKPKGVESEKERLIKKEKIYLIDLLKHDLETYYFKGDWREFCIYTMGQNVDDKKQEKQFYEDIRFVKKLIKKLKRELIRNDRPK